MKEKLCQLFVMGIGFAVLLIILSNCAPAEPQISLTEKDLGSQVSLTVGQSFSVTLELNITTGYTWEAAGLNPSLIEQVGEAVYKAPQSGAAPIVGAGGSQTFQFKAKAPGQVEFKLIYHRTFEKDVPPLKTYSVTLVIK